MTGTDGFEWNSLGLCEGWSGVFKRFVEERITKLEQTILDTTPEKLTNLQARREELKSLLDDANAMIRQAKPHQ